MIKTLLSPFLLFASFLLIFNNTDAQTWTGLGTGTNGTVNAVAVWNGNVYVAGNFTMAGSATVMNIAKWDGTTWSALGSGLGAASNNVSALCVYNGALYAGGNLRQTPLVLT